jgi:hypothetical protein
MDPIFNRIQSTQGYGARQGVKVLVYSPAGYGKTTLCATCPAPIILSAESGLLTLARNNLPYLEVKSLADLREYHQWLKSSAEPRKHFRTICLDSISEIAEVVLVASKAKVKDGRMAYGEMIDSMHSIIKEFRDIPGYHVYLSSKQERVKNEVTGVVTAQPMMPGNKLGQAMPYFPDEVFQLDIEGTGPGSYRLLRTQPGFMFEAKDRSGLLDPIEEPHLGKIFDKINKQQEGTHRQ